jgi:hypothetical protein
MRGIEMDKFDELAQALVDRFDDRIELAINIGEALRLTAEKYTKMEREACAVTAETMVARTGVKGAARAIRARGVTRE